MLGNLYSFGAMLSFTTAHAAIVTLRVNDPDRERPYRSPWGVRIKGVDDPDDRRDRRDRHVRGVGGRDGAAQRGSLVGIPWMIVGMARLLLLPQAPGPRPAQGLPHRARPSARRTSRSSSTRRRWCRSSATTSAPSALSSAAKLIGDDGVVYAVFVLPVPSQLSLEAGLEEEEAQGRSVLESARIQARRAGIKIHTGLIRTRNPGAALVEEAERVGADVIYWSTIHAPAGEQRIGPTAAYLL